VLRVVAWAPIVVAVAVLLALYALARRLWAPSDEALPLLAVALAVLAPGTLIDYSMLGFGDHHVVEVLLTLLVCQGVMGALETEGRAVGAALPMAVFLFTWAGAPMVLLLVLVAFLAGGLLKGASWRAPLRYALSLAVLYLVPSLLIPDLVMYEGAHGQALRGIVALGTVIPAILWAATEWRGPRPRLARVVATLSVAAVAGVAATPSSQWALAQLLAPRSPLISEQQPFQLADYLWTYGPLALLGPLGMALAARSGEWRRTVALAFGAPLLLLWIQTGDFTYAPPVWLALFSAEALGAHPIRFRKALLGAVAAALLVLAGLGWLRPPWPTADAMQATMIVDDNWSAAMRWLRDQTPPSADYGVLSSWDYGHIVAFLGKRPVVASLTLSTDETSWFTGVDEEAAARLLRTDVRYVLVDARMVAEDVVAELRATGHDLATWLVTGPNGLPVLSPLWAKTLAARLYEDDASGLSHFRLVYETRGTRVLLYRAIPGATTRVVRMAVPPTKQARAAERDPIRIGGVTLYGGRETSAIKIFQHVAGARIVGRTAPHGEVRGEIALRSTTDGRRMLDGVETQADASGRFTLTVPWSTAFVPASAVQPEGPWVLERAGRETPPSSRREVRLSEAQVERGEAVDVGRL
jgi:asparagine N-glycosylation enzyme membrane subunit Stt3